MAVKRPPLSDEPDDRAPAPEEDVVIVSKKAKAADPSQPAVAPAPPPPAPQPDPAPVYAPQPAPQPAPAYAPQPAYIDTTGGMGNAMMAQQTVQMQQQTAQYQAQASVGLAQTSIDKEIVDDQISKENEHWMKAYWRPAMGWLYMIICFMDFVGFPLLTIFLPIIFKPFGLTMPYQAWQSLTLSNGGLMHLAFGAILGVSAFTRGQEKMMPK